MRVSLPTGSLPVRVAELMCSRLCHDLISPVGAINNGVELVSELGPADTVEAMDLIADSGNRAAARLQLYRLAYGAAGGQSGLGLDEAAEAIRRYLSFTRLTLDAFPVADTLPDPLPTGAAKMFANAVLLAEECARIGGALSVRAEDASILFVVSGRNADLSPDASEALSGKTPPEELTARTVQAYVAGQLATHYGFGLDCQASSEGQVTIALRLIS